jgi:hypothetical protein
MTKCANEGNNCICSTQIFYGEITSGDELNKNAETRTKVAESDGSTACTNQVFGDPTPGIRKACFCAVASSYESNYN